MDLCKETKKIHGENLLLIGQPPVLISMVLWESEI